MKKIITLLIIFSMSLSACSVFVAKPEVTVKELNVVGLDTNGLDLEFLATVKNPNPFDMKLLGYNYDVQVQALPFAKGSAREEVQFPSRSSTDVRLPFRVAHGTLWEVLKRLPDPDKIPYRLIAGLEVDTPVGAQTIPVNTSGSFAIPQRYRPSNLLKQLNDLFNGLGR